MVPGGSRRTIEVDADTFEAVCFKHGLQIQATADYMWVELDGLEFRAPLEAAS